jgi:hypothetical protein
LANIILVFILAINCLSCSQNYEQLSYQSEKILQYERERKTLRKLFSCDHSEREVDISEGIKKLLREASEVRGECDQLRDEGLRMTKDVGRQLTERDNAHSERVRSIEIGMAEKEKQLLQSSNLLRQQLADAKREIQQLQRQLVELESDKSLRMVLDMKKDETEQLKAANNRLMLETERFSGLDVKLQVQMQKTEEMNAVINMKNDQLRQVLDEYDNVQQQLEVEVSAHLACQQELEKRKWAKENFLVENEKRWKEVTNQRRSGAIQDVVQKDKALAYRFNC